MKLDLTSWMIRLKIKGQTGGTPSWGTALGQGKGYPYSFDNQEQYFSAMEKCSKPENTVSCPLGKGGRRQGKYTRIRTALFDNIFVHSEGNTIKLKGAHFIIIEVEENESFHKGRKSIKYNPGCLYRSQNAEFKNEQCNSIIEATLGITQEDGWFVSNIDFVNEKELHLYVHVVKGQISFKNLTERRIAMQNSLWSERINHYTTLASAVAIITGVKKENDSYFYKFRATRFDCLNDPNECTYGAEMYERIFNKKAPLITPFILSFCKTSDSPVMWRLYQSNIQFIFNKELVEKEINNRKSDKIDLYCGNVLYAEVNDIKSSNDFEKETNTKITEEKAPEILSLLKPKDFDIENEWRVIATETDKYDNKFEDINSRIVGASSRYGLIKMYREISIPVDALLEIIVYEFNQEQFKIIRSQLIDLLSRIGLANISITQTKCVSVRN